MAISNQQIIDFLASNPTNQQIADAMTTFKVSPEQISNALTEQLTQVGPTTTTYTTTDAGDVANVNPSDLGGGFSAYYKAPTIEQTEQGVTSTSTPELGGFSRVDPANPDYIQYYDDAGKYVGQEKMLSSGQQAWSDLGPIVKAFAGQYVGQLLSESGLLNNIFGNSAETVAPTDVSLSTPFSADYSLANGTGAQGLSEMGGAQGLLNGASENLASMGGGQGITINLGAPSTTLADALATFGGVNPSNLAEMGGAQGLTYQTPTGLVTSTGTLPIGTNPSNTRVLGETGINTATNIGGDLGKVLDAITTNVEALTPTIPTATPTTTTKAASTTPVSVTDVLKTIGAVAPLVAVATAVTPKQTTPTGYDIVPIPENWKAPVSVGNSSQTPLMPINFGNRNLLIGTQWEKFLDHNYGKVPEPVQYSQPSNLSYNDLMGILGSKQGMPSPSSLSINDIISGIQNQYGQTPTSTVG